MRETGPCVSVHAAWSGGVESDVLANNTFVSWCSCNSVPALKLQKDNVKTAVEWSRAGSADRMICPYWSLETVL